MSLGIQPQVEWPENLRSGPVELRRLRRRDRKEWLELRAANREWLRPWEATFPYAGDEPQIMTFRRYVRALDAEARDSAGLTLAIAYDGRLAGQVSVSPIFGGAVWSGSIGYWVSQELVGKKIAPTAVAMLTDYCFGVIGLHRIELNIKPDNVRSLTVPQRLGFRDEGLRRAYVHIAGEWADHRTFALTSEEVPGGLLARWRAQEPVID